VWTVVSQRRNREQEQPDRASDEEERDSSQLSYLLSPGWISIRRISPVIGTSVVRTSLSLARSLQ
jgi:hypothetical protein